MIAMGGNRSARSALQNEEEVRIITTKETRQAIPKEGDSTPRKPVQTGKFKMHRQAESARAPCANAVILPIGRGSHKSTVILWSIYAINLRMEP